MDKTETIALYGSYVCGGCLDYTGGVDKPAAVDEVAVTEADTEVVSDEMLDVALDRAMLDDYSLYVYLSDASVE